MNELEVVYTMIGSWMLGIVTGVLLLAFFQSRRIHE